MYNKYIILYKLTIRMAAPSRQALVVTDRSRGKVHLNTSASVKSSLSPPASVATNILLIIPMF